jgi:Gram-negative bacterial TonB protein C-terminal
LIRLRSIYFFSLSIVCAVAPLTSHNAAKTADANVLQSFYIVSNFFSDDLGSSFIEILNVEPLDKNVRVQVIRISQANRYCGGYLVRAAERTLTNTAPRKIKGGADLCSYTTERVAAALKNAPSKILSDPSDSSTETIVAMCGSQQRIFEFPYPAGVDVEGLRRRDSGVFALWNTAYEVRRHTFGKKFTFVDLPPEVEEERKQQGTNSLFTLKSGKFQDAFSGASCSSVLCQTNYLAWILRDYSGPPSNTDPASVNLVNASALRFVKYEAPRFPVIAKTAHVYGQVRLSIAADPRTGMVDDVQLASGSALLGSSAIDAARRWQFVPDSLTGSPVEAILDFSLHCAGN